MAEKGKGKVFNDRKYIKIKNNLKKLEKNTKIVLTNVAEESILSSYKRSSHR